MTPAIAVLAILICLTAEASEKTVGQFTSIQGRVDVTRPGSSAVPANLDWPLQVGDIIRTKSRSRASIRFIDDSVVRINQSTRMEITEFEFQDTRKQSLLNLFRGKIQTTVSDQRGGDRNLSESNLFEVQTPTSVIGVRGTRFITYYQGATSGALFLEGKGYCYSLDRPDIIETIAAGQLMKVDNPAMPPVVRPATPLEIEGLTREERLERRPGKTDRPGHKGGLVQKPEARILAAAGGWISMADALSKSGMGTRLGLDRPENRKMIEGIDKIWDAIGDGLNQPETRPQGPGYPAGSGVPDIPAIEIGRVDLSGESDILSVQMNDVVFLSATTGGAPSLWKTDNVSGEFSARPEPGHAVGLSGNGVSAGFTVGAWAGGVWSAEVEGTGDIDRTNGAGTAAVRFSGNAGGIYEGDAQGVFTGAGGGIVEKR